MTLDDVQGAFKQHGVTVYGLTTPRANKFKGTFTHQKRRYSFLWNGPYVSVTRLSEPQGGKSVQSTSRSPEAVDAAGVSLSLAEDLAS